MYRFALFLTGAVLLLILAGGLVTSHEAGLAVPDWPLSYGQAFPPMVGNVFWEHGHRMIAGTVGVLTFILALWIQVSEKPVRVKKLAWVTFAAVILQALLGGLTVLYLLPAPVSIFHACLAQTFFCLVISLAFFLKPAKIGFQPPNDYPEGLQKLSFMTAGIIFLQLILGAVVRHTGWGVEWHVFMAFAVVAHVFMLAGKIVRGNPQSALFKPAAGIGLLTIVQFFLGIGSFVFRHMLEQGYAPSKTAVFFTAAHQTNGALVLGTSVLIALMVKR